MSKIKTRLIGALIACTYVLPVLADNMEMQSRQMMLVTTKGNLHIMRKPDKALYDYILSKGDAMPTGVVMMLTQDGKMVIAKDAKMNDGKMLSEAVLAK